MASKQATGAQKKMPQISDPKKDQNIQSKLLGTNVNEISVEKFRNAPPVQPNYRLNGKLTEDILKTITGKFSVDVIFVLDLSNQNLMSIDPLETCSNLMMLNLKQNQIKDLYPLRESRQLVYLNLSSNKIAHFETLKNLHSLTNLHAEENLIKSTKNLKGLDQAGSLRTLYLKTLSGNIANDVCQEKNYRQEVFLLVPSLRRLDGIPKGMELDNGESLKNKKEVKVNLDLSGTGVWYTKQYPKIEMPKDLRVDGEEDLKSQLRDCKSLVSQLEAKLKALAL